MSKEAAGWGERQQGRWVSPKVGYVNFTLILPLDMWTLLGLLAAVWVFWGCRATLTPLWAPYHGFRVGAKSTMNIIKDLLTRFDLVLLKIFLYSTQTLQLLTKMFNKWWKLLVIEMSYLLIIIFPLCSRLTITGNLRIRAWSNWSALFKNVSNCLNTNINSYLGTSGG